MGTARRTTVALLSAALLIGGVAPAVARPTAQGPARKPKLPRPIDPQSWEVPEDMTWGDYRRIPGTDWMNPEY
ncbi:MAG TPA: hypothetical protein VEV43_08835, partial [Actinomycetota bacterium]|nr:hypothetical protein [Actinomycetota bacterium]